MYVFLFTDIQGSTRLWEEHTAEMGEVIARHDAILQGQVEACGGRITKHTGDGITAAFEGGQPLTCALETQKTFAAQTWGEIGELQIRVGVHAGEAEFHASAGTPEGDYFGPPVNATARVMSAAWGGQVLLTPEVTEASPLPEGATLLDLGEHLLKDVSAPQHLYQLVHSELQHDFPPPRTLSGQSIRQAVDERGGQMAGLEPEAMGIALVAATLLPVFQGELNPATGALEGNLGVLEDLDAVTLSGFVVSFVERLQMGDPMSTSELEILLQRELRVAWQAGDDSSLALRADASRLLQAVHGVEAAMTAASDEVKEALARGLADLGGQFGEFRWMLAGVQDTLTEMRARQALQLALQREQLDLQRQQLVKTNLLLHRQGGYPAVAELTVEGEVDELPPAEVACPYMGLAAFEAEDAEYFFGREELVAQLTAQLAGTRFLAVVGPSGSGKSSLVRAGLLPAVWGGALPGSQEWHTLVLTPGAHPLNELAVRLSMLGDDRPGAVLQELEGDPRVLELTIRRALAEQPAVVKLLLVVDQFEEVFALCRDEAERRRFIEALLYAVEAQEGRTVVVPTIRADFYGRCADYPHLAERMSDGVLVGPMGEKELRAAIEQPAAVVGLRLEAGLAEMILDDVAGEPGALPLMSHALLETFVRRRGAELTLSGYAASGGVAGAIAQTADTAYQGLEPEEQALARDIFLRLTELGEEGAQDTRRRVAPSELVRREEEAEAVEALLGTLAGARLVTMGEDTVEVAHEALIREWPELRGWLEDDREGLRVHRHLTEAAVEWQRLGREQGELYRGARLAAAGEWAEAHGEALNPLEREFLAASQELAQRREAEREAQRQRELEAAKALAAEQEKRAEEQAESAGRLRQRALLLAGAMVVAVVLAVLAFISFRQADQSANSAQVASTQAVSERYAAETAQALEADQREVAVEQTRLAVSRELAGAAINSLDEDPERSVLLALEALEAADTLEARNALRRALPEIRILYTLPIQGLSSGVAFSPDGALLAASVWLGKGGGVMVWDAETGEELFLLEATYAGHPRVAFSPDGTQLFASSETELFSWEIVVDDSGEITAKNPFSMTGYMENAGPYYTIGVERMDFSPDGEYIALAHWNGAPMVFDLETMSEVLRLEGHTYNCRDVDYSPDGRLLATVCDDLTIKIWDAETGEERLSLVGHSYIAYSVEFSPDGTRLVTADEAGVIIIWDPVSGEKLLTITAEQGGFFGVSFTADGKRLVTPMMDGTVRVWDAVSGNELVTYAGHSGSVQDAVISPDGTLMASAGTDGTIKMWTTGLVGELGAISLGSNASLWGINYSPDGALVAIADSTGRVSVWDPAAGELVFNLPEVEEAGSIWAVAYSPDGSQLAFGAGNGPIHIWDLESQEYVKTLSGHTGGAIEVGYSPDGQRLVSAGFDGMALLWDLESGQAMTLTHDEPSLFSITFSPDGRRVATVSPMEESIADEIGIYEWDATTGELLRMLPVETFALYRVRYSPDGKLLVAGTQEGNIFVWEAASGELLRTLTGHTGLVPGLAFSPDGKYLASSSKDNTVKVWDIATGEELATLYGQTGSLNFLDYSPDGTRIATAAADGTLRTFVLSTEELISLAKSRVTRSLTTAECQKYLHVDECPVSP
jgi:WD40 repeat protein/class 3 adenylate cyclase